MKGTPPQAAALPAPLEIQDSRRTVALWPVGEAETPGSTRLRTFSFFEIGLGVKKTRLQVACIPVLLMPLVKTHFCFCDCLGHLHKEEVWVNEESL